MNCVKCGCKEIVRNGRFRIELGKSVLRFRCTSCGKSFRSSCSVKKQERRGRPRLRSQTNNLSDSYSKILDDLIRFYGYKMKLSFYKSGIIISGKSRPTIRRYISKGNKNLNQDFIVNVFKKVKTDFERMNGGRLTLSIYRRLQTIANRIVKVTLGPPPLYKKKHNYLVQKSL